MEDRGRYVWQAHSGSALEAGTRPEAIAAVRGGTAPAGLAEDEAVVVEFAKGYLRTRQVSDATYARAVDRLGPKGVVQLTLVVGHYRMVCMANTVFEFTRPGEDLPPLPK